MNYRMGKKMNDEIANPLLLYFFVLPILLALLVYWALSSHRRRLEATARTVLVQFGDYMLANLMSPEEVTLIDCADEFNDNEVYREYQTIYLEASRLSARQNLTGENLSEVIDQAKKAAEELRRGATGIGL